MFNVVVINERTGLKVILNVAPVTHEQGCVWLKKLTKYSWRRNQIEAA